MPPILLPCQHEGPEWTQVAKLINEVAHRRPSKGAFDELAYPLSPLVEEGEDFKFIIDSPLNMAHSMPPTAIDICTKDGSFVCRAHGLLFQGFVLAYDPMHDAAEWVQFKGIASDMTLAEESAAVEMLDYVPTQKQSVEMRLDKISEFRTFDSPDDEDTAAKVVDDATKVADSAAKAADDLEAETLDDPNTEGGESLSTGEDSALASEM